MPINVADPKVFIGLLIGGAVPFLFTALAIRAVGRTAGVVVQEVRKQFADGKIMQGEKEPEYGPVIDICTEASLRELATPALLAVLTPVIVGFGINFYALGAFLAAVILVGQLMANYLRNAGGAWDNAKKYIEDGHHGGKGSDPYKAAVIGDTVGDPFKDTAGPALNPLIKVMNLVSLLILPAIISLAGQRRRPLLDRRRRAGRADRRHASSPAARLASIVERPTSGLIASNLYVLALFDIESWLDKGGLDPCRARSSSPSPGCSSASSCRATRCCSSPASCRPTPAATSCRRCRSRRGVIFVAAVVGDQVGYLFGRKVGPTLFDRPKSRLFNPTNVARAHVFFEQHGPTAIVLARFVPIVRTFTPIVAGVAEMKYRTFVTYNILGGFLWGVGVTTLGYFLGEIEVVKDNLEIAASSSSRSRSSRWCSSSAPPPIDSRVNTRVDSRDNTRVRTRVAVTRLTTARGKTATFR